MREVGLGMTGWLLRSSRLRRPHFFQQWGRVPRFRARVTFGSRGSRSFPSMPPAAPFLSAAKEMGEITPPKTNGFGNSFVPILMQWKRVPQGIGHEPTLAAADMAVREDWRSYRLGDYQIAHLPLSAASAGAAQRAAGDKNMWQYKACFVGSRILTPQGQ